jgi:hypothetical protein
MNIAAVNGESLGPTILRELVRLGGEVDGADDSGDAALHIAPTIKAVSSIEYLAIRTRQNGEGHTPLKCFERASQSMYASKCFVYVA